MNTQYEKRKKDLILAVKEDIRDQLDTDDPVTLSQMEPLFKILSKTLEKHCDLQLKPILTVASSTSLIATLKPTTSAKTIQVGKEGGNKRSLAWHEWQRQHETECIKNGQDPKKAPNGSGKTAWKFFNDEIYGKMSEDEKQAYADRVREIKAKTQTTTTTTTTKPLLSINFSKKPIINIGKPAPYASAPAPAPASSKKQRNVSANDIFRAVHKDIYKAGEKYWNPHQKTKTDGHRLLQNIWTQHFKKNPNMAKPYEDLKDKILQGLAELSTESISRLPHINFDICQTDNWTLDQLKLVDD